MTTQNWQKSNVKKIDNQRFYIYIMPKLKKQTDAYFYLSIFYVE